MTSRGYLNDFYRQFEELNQKLDSLLEENKQLKLEHKREVKKSQRYLKNKYPN